MAMSKLIKGTRHLLIHRGRMWQWFGVDICQHILWIPNVIVGFTGSQQDMVTGSRQRSCHRKEGITRMPDHHLCLGKENPDYWQKAVPSLEVASVRCFQNKVDDGLVCDINNWLHPRRSAHNYWAGSCTRHCGKRVKGSWSEVSLDTADCCFRSRMARVQRNARSGWGSGSGTPLDLCPLRQGCTTTAWMSINAFWLHFRCTRQWENYLPGSYLRVWALECVVCFSQGNRNSSSMSECLHK